MPRWAQFAIFLSLTLLIYGGAHFFVYRSFAGMMGLAPGRALWALRTFFIVAALSFIASRLLLEWGLNPAVRVSYWAAALWMGLFLYLLLGCLVAYPLYGVVSWFAPAGAARAGKWLSLAVVVAAVATSVAAYVEACHRLKIVDLDIPVKGGSPALDGFTIVQLTDIHLGVIVDGGRLEKIVATVNGLHPYLVVVTGDLMDENADRQLALADPLQRIQSRYGLLAVTGNHEYYAGAEKIIRHGAEIGMRFLLNEKIVLPNGLVVCGLNDPTAARMGGAKVSLADVLGDAGRTAPVVLLHHQPTIFPQAGDLGVDLMLSGHTHNGQLWPLARISKRIYPYVHGLYVRGASRLYVSAGVGTWGPPMRLAAAPEIVRIRLRTGTSAL